MRKLDVTQEIWKKTMGYLPQCLLRDFVNKARTKTGSVVLIRVSTDDVEKFINRYNAKHNTLFRIMKDSVTDLGLNKFWYYTEHWNRAAKAANDTHSPMLFALRLVED